MALLTAAFWSAGSDGAHLVHRSRLRCDDSFGGRAHISIIAGTYRQG